MGFVNKHEARDQGLPYSRKKLLDAIEKDLLNDDNILAFFYGGSIGNGNTDLWSDIDLRIVVGDEKLRDFIADKKERSRNWGNVLYFEDITPLAAYTVAHYDCFVKVDVFYYTRDNIQPSVWLKNIKIIKDTNGMMASNLEKSIALMYEPSLGEIELWRSKFFAYLHEAYRRAMRKEYYYALQCIDNLRLSMSAAWYMDKGVQPNTFGDWAKYEGDRSELDAWQKALLKSWECGRNTIEIMTVMKNIVHEFKKVHSSLCNKLEIEEDSELINKAVKMVI